MNKAIFKPKAKVDHKINQAVCVFALLRPAVRSSGCVHLCGSQGFGTGWKEHGDRTERDTLCWYWVERARGPDREGHTLLQSSQCPQA